MRFSLQFTTILWVLSALGFVSGLSTRALAQSTAPQPLLQVEGILQADDNTLEYGSFYDIHEFTGQADQIVTILLESEAFDAYLILEDDQGNLIVENDDISSTNTNAALVITLTNSGGYRVIAIALKANTQGPYHLTIQPIPDDQPNPLLSPLLSAAEMNLLEANQGFEAGNARFERSDFRAALALWEKSLKLFRTDNVRTAFSQESRQGEATLLSGLGNAHGALGNYTRAIDFYQQSLDISREIGNRQGEASSLGGLGIVYYFLRKYEQAIHFSQQWLDISREIGDRQGEVSSLSALGTAYRGIGDYARAIDFYQQSLDISREIGDRQGEVPYLGGLRSAYLNLGDDERDIAFNQQSLDISR